MLRNLIFSNNYCTRCGQLTKLSKLFKTINVNYILKCLNKAFRFRQFFKHFFQKLHFKLQKYIAVFYYWALQTLNCIAAEHLQISANSLVDHYNFLRDICSWKLVHELIRLGGELL